ncbi:MAG: NTP transferase domain-containing protein [Melioribacteraceae bacterium]|nr:NTP transferase domain-containing protein [Melioribacteraceae bacterium]
MNDTKVVTVIQARLGSSRLPKKVLLSIKAKPLLLRMVERVEAAQLTGEIVVATSTESEDDPVEEICNKYNLEVYRGDLHDLLDRHYMVSKKYNADAVVKIPSDCPLIDPLVIDKVLKHYLDNRGRYDYVSNLHPATYPDGNDVEIMSFKLSKKLGKRQQKISSVNTQHHTFGKTKINSKSVMLSGKPD